MSNTFTLDALINETVRRYAPVEVDLGDGDIIELKALMRLGEKERKSVIASIEEINDLDYDEDCDEEDLSSWSDLVVDSCTKIC